MAIQWMSRLANLTADADKYGQDSLKLETEEERKRREAERGELVRSYPYPQYSNEPDPYKDEGVKLFNSGSRSYQNGKPILAVDTYPRQGVDYSYHSTTPNAKPEQVEQPAAPLDLEGLYEPPEKKPDVQNPIIEEPYKTYADVPKTIPEFADSKPETSNPLRNKALEKMMKLDRDVSAKDMPVDNSPRGVPDVPPSMEQKTPVSNMSLTEAPESPFPAKEVQTPSDLEKNALERLKRQWDYSGDVAGSEGGQEQVASTQEYTGGRPEDVYAPFVEPITPVSSSNPLRDKILMGLGGFAHIMGTPEMDRMRLNRAQMANEMSNSAQRMFNAVPGVNIKDRDYVTPITQQIQLKNAQKDEIRNAEQQKFNNTATLARLSVEKQIQDRQDAADWEIKELDFGILSHNKRTNETIFKEYTPEQLESRRKQNEAKKAASLKPRDPYDKGFTFGLNDTSKQVALNKPAPIELQKAKIAAANVVNAYNKVTKDPVLIRLSQVDQNDKEAKIAAQTELVNWYDTHQAELIPFISAQANASNSGVLNQGEFERFSQNLMGVSLSTLLSLASQRVAKGSPDDGLIERVRRYLLGGLESQITAADAANVYSRLLQIVPDALEPNGFSERLYNFTQNSVNTYRNELESFALSDEELEAWNAPANLYVGRNSPYFQGAFKEGGDFFVRSLRDPASLKENAPHPKEPAPAYRIIEPVNPPPVVPAKKPLPNKAPKGKPAGSKAKGLIKANPPAPANKSPVSTGSWKDHARRVEPITPSKEGKK